MFAVGNSMGEVSFAAVLHWVTRIDDFINYWPILASVNVFCTFSGMRNAHILS